MNSVMGEGFLARPNTWTGVLQESQHRICVGRESFHPGCEAQPASGSSVRSSLLPRHFLNNVVHALDRLNSHQSASQAQPYFGR